MDNPIENNGPTTDEAGDTTLRNLRRAQLLGEHWYAGWMMAGRTTSEEPHATWIGEAQSDEMDQHEWIWMNPWISEEEPELDRYRQYRIGLTILRRLARGELEAETRGIWAKTRALARPAGEEWLFSDALMRGDGWEPSQVTDGAWRCPALGELAYPEMSSTPGEA